MTQTHPTTIYVVHDDPIVMQTLLDFLSDLGYSAVPVTSVWELTASMETNRRKPDIVVAGLKLVEKGGIDILREMHHKYPEVAVVLIVSAQRSFSAAEAIACGVYAYLREPIRLSELELSLTRLDEDQRLCRHHT